MIPRLRILGVCGAVLATLGCPRNDTPEQAADAAPQAVQPIPAAAPAWGETLLAVPRPLSLAELARSLEGRDAAQGTAEAWAVGRIGGAEAQAQLLGLLDGDAKATSAQLAAIGFLEPPQPATPGARVPLEDAVWTRLAVTEDPGQVRALMFAAARIGGAASQQRLGDSLHADVWAVDEELNRTTLEVIGMLCARGHAATLSGLEAAASALEATDALATAAAYAVGRCASPSAELLAGPVRGRLVERIEPRLSSKDTKVARRAWKAIGALGEMPASTPEAVLAAGVSDMPWRVEVEAVRALAGHADGRGVLVSRLGKTVASDWKGPRVHVALETLRGLRDAVAGAPELLAPLRPWAQSVRAERPSAAPRRAKELALLDCEFTLLEAVISGDHAGLSRCAAGVPALPSHFADLLVVEASLRTTARAPADTLLSLSADPRPVVASAAIAALVDLDDARTSQTLREALSRKDTGVRAAAATAIATRSMDRARRDAAAAAPLATAVSTWPNATAIEARIAAITALGNLARSRPSGEPVPPWLEATLASLASDASVAVRQAALAALRDEPGVASPVPVSPRTPAFDDVVTSRFKALDPAVRGLRLETSAGTITIAFEGASPINQSVLASLTREGFFDGLSFHRVVPGFVAQGGDPHGDGYGGPGFVVPCERSNLQYERGVVGMALAGKDTGGSQFFIAQGREPRLDGLYTIVGRVTEGIEAVDRLLPHDLILDAELVLQ